MKDKTLKNHLFLLFIGAILILSVFNIQTIFSFIGTLLTISTPILIGLGIAFVSYRPFVWIKTKLTTIFPEKLKKVSAVVAVLSIYFLLFSLIGLVLAFLIPQLKESISTFTNNISNYAIAFSGYFQGLFEGLEIENIDFSKVQEMIVHLPTTLARVFAAMFPAFFNMTTNLLSRAIEIFIGLVIGAYILCDMPHFKDFFVTLITAYCSKDTARKAFYIGRLSFVTFSRYVTGQCVEAVILGVLCFVGMLICGFAYPLLISVLIGITGLIPLAGAFIGAIPAVFLLLMVNPAQALWFIPFILLVQQIEGDVIYPRVVGNSIGLPAFWVMTAVIIGGGIGGVLGMLFAVPILSVIYQLVEYDVKNRLVDLDDPEEK